MRLPITAMAAMLLTGLTLSGCERSPQPEPVSQTVGFVLPEPISNNAVAVADGPDGPTFYSFNGLKAGKTWKDTSNAAYACVVATESCKIIASVPVPEGRLASAAVPVAGKIYIFGGYTVAANGDEVSTPEVFAYDPATGRYEQKADMPTPVDDALVVPYQNRFIYVISGWHDEGNVSTVQLFDTMTGAWTEATPFPGTPVFGHAGGISGDSIIVSDGVATVFAEGKRGVPARPSGGFFAYDLKKDQWIELGRLAESSMDHRGLAQAGQDYYILGGMDEEQTVIDRIVKFRISN